jgi:hypothetical protein
MSTLDSWTEAACAELGIGPAEEAVRTVLDLARDVAHRVDRPAAPVTSFLLGIAVGQGQQLGDAAARLRALAEQWTASSD